jgi:hypothetical protein
MAIRPLLPPIRVYYDPDDPATATLEPGELSGIFSMAMVAGGFIGRRNHRGADDLGTSMKPT